MLRVSTLVLLICIIIEIFVANVFLCSIYVFIDICKRKKGQKQVKKKAFKTNAKIEDVGLNEDGNKKWSLNFDDQPKSQNPTYCFFFLAEFTASKINALLIFYSLFLLRTSSYCIKKSTFYNIVMACLTFY